MEYYSKLITILALSFQVINIKISSSLGNFLVEAIFLYKSIQIALMIHQKIAKEDKQVLIKNLHQIALTYLRRRKNLTLTFLGKFGNLIYSSKTKIKNSTKILEHSFCITRFILSLTKSTSTMDTYFRIQNTKNSILDSRSLF